MSRVAAGWVDSPVGPAIPNIVDGTDEVDGLSEQEIEHTLQQWTETRPLGLQQTVNREAERWGQEWQIGEAYGEPQWPVAMMGRLPPITADQLRQAASTFPTDTGLGWDQMHPGYLVGPQTAWSSCWRRS